MLYEKSNRKMTKICKQISRSYLHNGKVVTDDGEGGTGNGVNV